MTIVIGIKCASGIVVACDSRTTDPTGLVRDNANKIHVITFQDTNTAIVAEAGNEALSSRTVEMISTIAKERRIIDYRTMASCAEESVAQLKHQIREQYRGTSEELQRHFESYAFELMIAYYHEGRPYLFTLDFVQGLAIKRDRLHHSIGCGSMLADFLLDGIDVVNFGTGEGMWTAVYAVEEVKKFDPRCGGKTRSAVIKYENGLSVSFISADAPMSVAVSEALAFSAERRLEWQQTALKRIEAVIQGRPVT